MVDLLHLPIAPLFVPGSRPDQFAKAAASGADAVIIDLEDAVAAADKEEARKSVLEYADGLKPPVIVRINARGTPWYDMDTKAIRSIGITAVMLPKAESAADIVDLSARFGHHTAIIALVETAAGLANLPQILAAPNVVRIAFGSIDFALDIGCALDQQVLLNARSEIVWRSRAAKRAAPLDGVTRDFNTSDAVEADAAHGAALGFGGKLAIHPRQIEPIQRAFRPSETMIAWAQTMMAATAADMAIQVDGQMVDRPVIERARRVLARVVVQGQPG
jgi:citrate lyase subunit beta/citryl-CoA lyase